MTDEVKENKTSNTKKAAIVFFTSLFKCFLQIFSGMVTARILFPQDFGIISMAATFSSFIDVLGRFGIDAFIISDKEISRKNINSIYLLNIFIGIMITTVILIGARPVAIFYKTPEVKYILYFGAWSFLLNALISVPRALQLKDMRQTLVSKIELFQGFFNVFLIIIFALLGFRYLSYVIPLLITNFIVFLIYFFVSKSNFSWGFSKSFELEVVKRGLSYSKRFLPKAVLSFFVYNSDYMLVGYLLGSGILGYYFFGFEKSMMTVSMLSGLFTNMFFPLFSQIQTDNDQLKSKFLSIMEKLNFVYYPTLFLEIIMAKELIEFFYSSRWENSILTFQLLIGYNFFRIMMSVINILFDAVGKPEQNLKHFMLVTPMVITAFFIGAKFNGLIGVSIAAFFVHTLSSLLIYIRACRVFHWKFSEIMNVQLKFFVPIILQLPIIIPFKTYLETMHLPLIINIMVITILSFGLYMAFIMLFFKDVYNRNCLPYINKLKYKGKEILGLAV